MISQPIHNCRISGETISDTAGSRMFPWWSFTKTAIAICALRLAERAAVAAALA